MPTTLCNELCVEGNLMLTASSDEYSNTSSSSHGHFVLLKIVSQQLPLNCCYTSIFSLIV